MKLTKSNTPQIIRQMKSAGIILSVRTYRASGPGGQHRNKTESAVEIVAEWTIDGKPVRLKANASMKSQHDSRHAALKMLMARRDEAVKAAAAEANGETRNTDGGFGGAGQRRVRTYHQPDDRVVDGSGFQASYRATVGGGDLGPLTDGRRERLALALPLAVSVI